MRFPAAALLLLLALPSPAPAQEVRPYAGKYAGDPACARLMERLPQILKDAARAMGERLGLDAPDASNVVLELVDMPLGPQKDVQLGGTATRRVDGRDVQWITLNPETWFAESGDLEVEVAHEVTHALLRNALGEANHAALPKWVREGLAVWASGQGPGRVALWLGLWSDKPDPVAALLRGLDNPQHAISDYPEDYLAIAYIEAEKGVDGVKAFVKGLAAGKPAQEAAAETVGGTWDAFEKGARAYSQARLREARGQEASAAWSRTIAIYRSGKDWEAAKRGMYAVSVRFADSWAGALAKYYFGRSLQLAGDAAGGKEALLLFLGTVGPRTGLMDDALWNIARCEEELGEKDAAIATCDRLARDFSSSPLAPTALVKAAGLCEASGRAGEAKTRNERIVKDLPGTNAAAEAKKQLGR